MKSRARKLLAVVVASEHKLRNYFGISADDISILDRTTAYFYIWHDDKFKPPAGFVSWGLTRSEALSKDAYTLPIVLGKIYKMDDLLAMHAGEFGKGFIFVFSAANEVSPSYQ